MKFKRYIKESLTTAEIEAEVVEEPVSEAVDNMENRCEKCNTLLNDMGGCPKCDEGEEDYGDLDESADSTMSVREKLKQAYPELNFDTPVQESVECAEDLSNKEKLKRAYPELNFDTDTIVETVESVALDNKEKLIQAFPGVFSFDPSTIIEELDDEYDDDYEFDDVEQDRRHAALYGGDRMYCSCGSKLVMDEWGGYCPVCDAEEAEQKRLDNMYDDNI